MKDDTRSGQQQKSLEVYCRELAEQLNAAGISYKKFLEIMDEMDNSQESIKRIWRKIGEVKYGKTSTANLTREEMKWIFEEFTRNLSKIGIYQEWPHDPSEEDSFNKTYERET